MKKNHICVFFIFLFVFTAFGQNVTLTPLSVNNQSVSGGAINLGGTINSTVSLSVNVEMPTIPGDNGTITIRSVNNSINNIVTGGNGGALFFGEGKSATRSFVVDLLWSSFNTSGGYIYAEYKTVGGIIYKSSNFAVVKNATQSTTPRTPADAPDPTKIPNTICCNQTIRVGEKLALITGSQFLNPYAGQFYGINTFWQTTANGSDANFWELDEANKTISMGYITKAGNFTVTRGLKNSSNKPSNISNTVTITVLPSPIQNNEISIIGSANTDGSFEIINTNPKDILGDNSSINLKMFQNPYYVPTRGDTYINIDKYEWEYAILNSTTGVKSYKTIPNQFSSSLNSLFLPSDSSKDILYSVRRIALYQNLRLSSNFLKILIRGARDNNTICCNQYLEVSSSNIVETPAIITGTTAISNKNTYLFYQWQSQTVTENGSKFSAWTNIPQATSKDYNPTTPQVIPGTGRNQPTVPTYNYRRIATDNVYNGETYYSNEISLTNSKTPNGYSYQTFAMYPNPATSILNIEELRADRTSGAFNFDTANINITIVNSMGNIVNSNKFIKTSSKIITIDVSNLVNGLYILNISIDRTTRPFNEQYKFYKN